MMDRESPWACDQAGEGPSTYEYETLRRRLTSQVLMLAALHAPPPWPFLGSGLVFSFEKRLCPLRSRFLFVHPFPSYFRCSLLLVLIK